MLFVLRYLSLNNRGNVCSLFAGVAFFQRTIRRPDLGGQRYSSSLDLVKINEAIDEKSGFYRPFCSLFPGGGCAFVCLKQLQIRRTLAAVCGLLNARAIQARPSPLTRRLSHAPLH